MILFSTYNVKYRKHSVEKWIVVNGDVRNDGEKGYHTVAFRVKLFIGQEVLASAIVKVQGFRPKATRHFEVMIEGAHHDLIRKITSCELDFESAF